MGELMKNLQDIIEQEKAVAIMIQQLKQDIINTVENTPIPGVKRISPIVAIVKFSQIQNSVWNAEYYIAEVQAKYIEQALANTTTASAFIKKLSEIIEKKQVRINGNTYAINDTTISVLKKYI